MSKHGSFFVKAVLFAIAVLLLFILPPVTIRADVPAVIQVTIEDTESVPQGSTIEIPINIFNNTGIELAGFDLLIDFDPVVLTLVDVQPGQIPVDCFWEYFTYRYDVGVGLRIVAVADINDGDNHPDCLIGNTSGSIAIMTFNVSADPAYECTNFPVQFIWRDCTDNAFTDASGFSLFLSRYVYDWEFHVPIHADDVFPTYKGAPDECLIIPDKIAPVRKIDFTSGRVGILCSDSIDSRGDVNLNDIPYEIADFVLFQNYFIFGLSVFTIDVDKQIAATEVNGDGMALTLRDLVYIWRVIIGDATPLAKGMNPPAADTAFFIQDTDAKTVRLFYPDTLAGAYLIFDGDITPTYSGEMSFAYHLDTGYTHVLISPPHTSEPRGGFVEGQLFTYTGGGTLDSVEVADFYDALIPTVIQITEGEPACGDVNYDGDINIGDLVYLIGYIFKGGAPPYSLTAADVNCDGKLNFTDVIYLVEYLFRGGPVPCADCPR
jgi:hypothetical protein